MRRSWPPTAETLRSGIRIECRVLGALIVREMISRYGRKNVGFLWLVLEPMILTIGVMILWTMLRHDSHGLAIIAFVLSGYMPLTLWRHISSYLVSCVRHNLPLLYHRQIGLADVLIGRALLELAGTTIALVIVYTGARVAGFVPAYVDLSLLLAGWLFMAWFAFGVGLILACLSEMFEFVEKLIPPFQYLLLPISGMFFMVAWLPPEIRTLALYMPLVNCFELFRAGFFENSVTPYYDVSYLFFCCLVASALGFCLLERVQHSIRFE
jgi:capsular polysaccharide transport system permease protein